MKNKDYIKKKNVSIEMNGKPLNISKSFTDFISELNEMVHQKIKEKCYKER